MVDRDIDVFKVNVGGEEVALVTLESILRRVVQMPAARLVLNPDTPKIAKILASSTAGLNGVNPEGVQRHIAIRHFTGTGTFTTSASDTRMVIICNPAVEMNGDGRLTIKALTYNGSTYTGTQVMTVKIAGSARYGVLGGHMRIQNVTDENVRRGAMSGALMYPPAEALNDLTIDKIRTYARVPSDTLLQASYTDTLIVRSDLDKRLISPQERTTVGEAGLEDSFNFDENDPANVFGAVGKDLLTYNALSGELEPTYGVEIEVNGHAPLDPTLSDTGVTTVTITVEILGAADDVSAFTFPNGGSGAAIGAVISAKHTTYALEGDGVMIKAVRVHFIHAEDVGGGGDVHARFNGYISVRAMKQSRLTTPRMMLAVVDCGANASIACSGHFNLGVAMNPALTASVPTGDRTANLDEAIEIVQDYPHVRIE